MFHEYKFHTKMIMLLQKEFQPTVHYNCTILYYILLDQGHKKLPLNSDHHCNKVLEYFRKYMSYLHRHNLLLIFFQPAY